MLWLCIRALSFVLVLGALDMCGGGEDPPEIDSSRQDAGGDAARTGDAAGMGAPDSG